MTAVHRLILLALWAAAAISQAEMRSPGKWLIDLGRDYPLSPQAGLSEADAEIALSFMLAANRLEPSLSEGYLWQFDLLTALGRQEPARKALEQYCALQPDDLPARLNLIELDLAARQTAEARLAYCAEMLDQNDLPAILSAELHLQRAHIFYRIGQFEDARSAATVALERDPYRLAARALLATLQPGLMTPAEQADLLLWKLTASPADVPATVELADLLASWRLPEQAAGFYRHAIALIILADAQAKPIDLQLRLAEQLLSAGQSADARKMLNELYVHHPQRLDLLGLLVRTARQVDEPELVRDYLRKADRLWEDIVNNLSEDDVEAAAAVWAEAAWFYIHIDPRPQRALEWAARALTLQPEQAVALRAKAAALRMLERHDEARTVVEQLPDTDPWAVIEGSQLDYATGRQAEAKQRLRPLTTQPAGNWSEQTAALAEEWGLESAASMPAAAIELRERIGGFDARVLNYPAHPEQYISLDMNMDQSSYAPGEPWWCTFRLTNTGPFPITLGPAGMCRPELICTLNSEGDQPRSSGAVIRISLYQHTRLAVGQSIELRQTVDIGSIRSAMIGTPQQIQKITLSAILSPIFIENEEGRLIARPAVGGLETPAVHFTRRALSAEGDRIDRIGQLVRSHDIDNQIRGCEWLAMLIAEGQHLAAGRLKYQATRVDRVALQDLFLNALHAPPWQVRTRGAEALRWFGLDAQATQAALGLLDDKHWLVRGLALRALADHHRNKFLPVLKRYAAGDDDAWVRELASAMHRRINNNMDNEKTATAPAQ